MIFLGMNPLLSLQHFPEAFRPMEVGGAISGLPVTRPGPV